MAESRHCRACFEIIDSKKPQRSCNLQKNYKIQNQEVTLRQIMSELTGVYIDSGEMDVICGSCKESLISFYTFKLKVVDTDKKFQEIMSETVVESFMVKVKLEEDIKVEVGIEDTKVPRVQSKKRRVQKTYDMTTDGLYKCPKENCPGLFKKIARLEIHLRNIHPETDQTIFPCETCGEKFPTLLLQKQHNYKFHAPRPYICDICGNSYPFISSLRTHVLKIHVQDKKPEKIKQACTICGKVFATQDNMLRHRKEYHFPKELVPKPFTCHICGSQWSSKGKLDCHMKCHSAPTFSCDLCSKTFSRKSGILQHKQVVHNDNRPFFCDICGNKFKTKQLLQKHQTTHSDERPFKCPQCPGTFKLKDDLQSHEKRTHTTHGPVACHVCGKWYKVQSTLRKHMVKHNGQDIKCPHCDITYRDKGSLQFHVRTIHLGFKKRNACPFCTIHLSSRKQIVKHLKETHQKDLEASKKSPEELVQPYWTTDPSGENIGEKAPVLSSLIKFV